jgi:prepilin-type N-terminal cleavage/methylation domain-containing protein
MGQALPARELQARTPGEPIWHAEESPSSGGELLNPNPPPMVRSGFTLVELLIVVVILAILSVIALPRMSGVRTEAVCSALAASVTQVSMVVEVQHQKATDGSWPRQIRGDWFSSKMLPGHPDKLAGIPAIQTVNSPGVMHPSVKLLVPGSAGAYWYNFAEGVFRARVKPLSSTVETLAFYNTVNNCGLSSLGGGGLDR